MQHQIYTCSVDLVLLPSPSVLIECFEGIFGVQQFPQWCNAFFRHITQRDHKYATPPAVKPILCVAHLWKNEGVAPLREFLYKSVI